MRRSLEEYDPRLRGIHLIIGEWSHANLFSSNVYSIGNTTITFIDAGDQNEFGSITTAFQRLGLNIKNTSNVIITHSHDDHWGGVKALLQLTPLNVLVYEADTSYYRQEFRHLTGVNEYVLVSLKDGDAVEVEGRKLTVIHTPGHDNGSICLYDEAHKILFSGDTVFSSGTTGSLRSGNINDLKQSLRRLATLEIDIMLPGHGDVVLDRANEVIDLALERITWLERIPDDAPYWLRMRRSPGRRDDQRDV